MQYVMCIFLRIACAGVILTKKNTVFIFFLIIRLYSYMQRPQIGPYFCINNFR